MKLILTDENGKKVGQVDDQFKASGIPQDMIDVYVKEGMLLTEIAVRLSHPPYLNVEVQQ